MLLLAVVSTAYAQTPPLPEVTAEERNAVEAAAPSKAPAKPKKPRRLLVFNRDVRNGEVVKVHHPSVAIGNYALETLGRKTGAWEVTISGDPEIWRPASIRKFDAICFMNTTGVLTEDKELRWSLLDFVRSGGGFSAFHAGGGATFVQYPKYDQWPEFGRMLGGTENGGHPWNGELLTLKLDDPKNPLNAIFRGKEFQIAEQAFQLQEPVLRDHLRVLLSVDVEKTGFAPNRRILAARKDDKDFPVAWIRRYGKGRVFYSGFGHSSQVFWNPDLLAHFLAGIQYALGDLKADDSPDLARRKRY